MKLTPDDKVFVSSPMGALRPYREAADRTLKRIALEPILLEVLWGPLGKRERDDKLVAKVREEIAQCEAVITILGSRTGLKVPGSDFTLVEHEILSAHELGLPIFAFVSPGSRFFSQLESTLPSQRALSHALLAQCEEIDTVRSPDIFSSRLKQELKKRIESDVISCEFVTVSPVSREYWATLARYPEELQKCPPRFLEELVAELLMADGWEVELVARNNCPGPDIIAFSSKLVDSVPLSLIVECKRYQAGTPVDVSVIRNLVYWVNEEYRASLGMVVTTSRFTQAAVSLVDQMHRWRISLRDQSAIVEWLRKFVT